MSARLGEEMEEMEEEEEESRCSDVLATTVHEDVILTNAQRRPGPVAAIRAAPSLATSQPPCSYTHTHIHK